MPANIPSLQRVAWLERPGHEATLMIRDDIPVPTPGDNEVLVRILCSGVCHSDVGNIRGHAPIFTNIAGHEGVGDIVRVGPHVGSHRIGERVGVRWLYSTCGTCEICKIDSTSCPNQRNTGRHDRGTFAQYIIAPAAHVAPVPRTLPPEIVAPLLCAGLTIFSAIKKAGLRTDDWLVIPGAGGGIGHLGVQIAREKGYRVIAIDTGDEKRNLCTELGATEYLDFRADSVEDRVMEITAGYGAHAVIVTAGSHAAYQQGAKLLRNGGTLVCIGIPKDEFDLPLSPLQAIARGLTIIGSSVGSDTDLSELIFLAEKGSVVPRQEVYPMSEINDVMARLEAGEINGRAVVDVDT